MSEFSEPEALTIPAKELLRTADSLFEGVPYEESTIALSKHGYYNLDAQGAVAGKVTPEVEEAVKAEYARSSTENYEARAQKMDAWKQRSIGKVISDVLRRQNRLEYFEDRVEPGLGDIATHTRAMSGELMLGDAWPKLSVFVLQSYYEGNVIVGDQEFSLNPAATFLKVGLAYPLSDGTNVDLSVTHELYPYKEGIRTQSCGSRQYWNGVPHQPFSDAPTDPSVHMNRAMEMMMDGWQ